MATARVRQRAAAPRSGASRPAADMQCTALLCACSRSLRVRVYVWCRCTLRTRTVHAAYIQCLPCNANRPAAVRRGTVPYTLVAQCEEGAARTAADERLIISTGCRGLTPPPARCPRPAVAISSIGAERCVRPMQVRLMRASRVHADRPQGRVPRAVRQWGRALRHIAQPDSEAPSSTLSGTSLSRRRARWRRRGRRRRGRWRRRRRARWRQRRRRRRRQRRGRRR